MLPKQSSWSLCSLEGNVKNRNIQNYVSGYNLLDQDTCQFCCSKIIIKGHFNLDYFIFNSISGVSTFVDLKHINNLCSVLDWQIDFIADNNDNNPEYNKSLHIHRINRNFIYHVKHVNLSSLALVRTPSLPTWILATKSWLLKAFENTYQCVWKLDFLSFEWANIRLSCISAIFHLMSFFFWFTEMSLPVLENTSWNNYVVHLLSYLYICKFSSHCIISGSIYTTT
jgi:hypothetical protein